MSNYYRQAYVSGQVIVGEERVNGTGQVQVFEATDAEPALYLTLSNDEAVELATAILRHAASARARQISEEQSLTALKDEYDFVVRRQAEAERCCREAAQARQNAATCDTP